MLESGQAIARGLLIRGLEALAWFATGMGMQNTFNSKLLLVLRFVGRVVGLEDPELVQQARYAQKPFCFVVGGKFVCVCMCG